MPPRQRQRFPLSDLSTPQTAEIALEAIGTIYRIAASRETRSGLTLDRLGGFLLAEMENSKTLLIVWHSRTGTARAMADAAMEEASMTARLLRAEETQPGDLLDAGGYLFICPENLASMTGMMKEMFDRCYYPVLGRLEGRPFATAIAAGSDGEGAQRQMDRIAKGWRLKRVAEPLIVNTDAQTPKEILAEKTVCNEELTACRDLCAALAEGLRQGVF